MKQHNRKSEATVDFTEYSSLKRGKMNKYDTSELMNKLEEFSDVWNDFPTVENPKQSSTQWFGDNDKQSSQESNENFKKKNITETLDERIEIKTFTNKMSKNGKYPVQTVCDKIQVSDNEIINHQEEDQSYETSLEAMNDSKKHLNVRSKKARFSNPSEDIKNQSEKYYDSNLADLKRKTAVQKQRQVQVDKKNIIKQALSSLDGKQKLNKKILFDDADEIKGEHEKANKILSEDDSTGRKMLFNDDGDDEGSEFESKLKINHQFEGKKGQKLLELQSKFASDSRFNLDPRFYESGSEESDNELPENTKSSDEKKKQLAILESVVKRQIKPLSEIKKTTTNKDKDTFLLRFDPSREEHSKYIVKPKEPTKDGEKKADKKKKHDPEMAKKVQESKAQVSSERFYTVKEDLKEALKKETKTEFSLLKIFGSKETEDVDSKPEQSQSVKKPKHATKNPFKYDSSDSEPEVENTDTKSVKKGKDKETKHSVSSWKTTFFFTENDSRLQEAEEFLKGPEESENYEEYAEKRKVLKDFIRHKLKNNNRKKCPFKRKLGGKKIKAFHQKKAKKS